MFKKLTPFKFEKTVLSKNPVKELRATFCTHAQPKPGRTRFDINAINNLKLFYILENTFCHIIVFVWSIHDGGNVVQRTMTQVPSKTL